jgi:hypothetical protein
MRARPFFSHLFIGALRALLTTLVVTGLAAAQPVRANDVLPSGVRPEPGQATPHELTMLVDALHQGHEFATLKAWGVSLDDVESGARPRNQPDKSPYALAYRQFLADCKAGGTIFHFKNERGVVGEGYALIRDDKVVATLPTSIH